MLQFAVLRAFISWLKSTQPFGRTTVWKTSLSLVETDLNKLTELINLTPLTNLTDLTHLTNLTDLIHLTHLTVVGEMNAATQTWLGKLEYENCLISRIPCLMLSLLLAFSINWQLYIMSRIWLLLTFLFNQQLYSSKMHHHCERVYLKYDWHYYDLQDTNVT